MKTMWKAIAKKDGKLYVIPSKCSCSKVEFKKALEGLGYQTNSKMIKPSYEFDYVLKYTSAKASDFDCGISHLINPELLKLIKKYKKLYSELTDLFCRINVLLDKDNYPIDGEEEYEFIFDVFNILPNINLDNLVSWYAKQYHSEE